MAQCLEVDIASQGETEQEALDNLWEALELHFEPPQATRPAAFVLSRLRLGRLVHCLSIYSVECAASLRSPSRAGDAASANS